MSMRKHRKRQTHLSAHNFNGRHLGVCRFVFAGRYMRYPFSYVPQDIDADIAQVVDEEFWNLV